MIHHPCLSIDVHIFRHSLPSLSFPLLSFFPVPLSPFSYVLRLLPPWQSPFLTTANVSYCGLEEQTLTLLLRSVRANCNLQVLKMEGNNLTGKGTFILSKYLKSHTWTVLKSSHKNRWNRMTQGPKGIIRESPITRFNTVSSTVLLL